MKTNTQLTNGGGVYIAPICTETDIKSEGVLCFSFEKPNEYDDIYNW